MIIAALARPGVCTQFLDELVDGHTWVTSRYILDEVHRKLVNKFAIPPEVAQKAIARIESLAESVLPVELESGACRDPEDLPVLGSAVSGRADLVVTIDQDLLAMGTFASIRIVRPGEGFRWLREGLAG